MTSEAKKRGKHKSSSSRSSNPTPNDQVGSSAPRERVVVLDVGGIRFLTRIGTLMGAGGGHEENMLSLMFSGRFPLVAEEDGSYFIDRDGTHFRFVLNYLRDSDNFVPPSDSQTCRELLREVEFYQLAPLIRLLRLSLLQYDPYLLSHDLESSSLPPSSLLTQLFQHPTATSSSTPSSASSSSSSASSSSSSSSSSSIFSSLSFSPSSTAAPDANTAASSTATSSSSHEQPAPASDSLGTVDSHLQQAHSTPLFLPPLGMKVCRHTQRRVYCTVRYLPGSTYDGWPIRIEGPLESKMFFCLNGGVPFPEKLTPNVKNIFGSELFGWKFRGIFITKIFNLLASHGWRIDTSNGSGGGKEKNFAEMYIFSKYASPLHYASSPFAPPIPLPAATASLSTEAQAHDHHHHDSPIPARHASHSMAFSLQVYLF